MVVCAGAGRTYHICVPWHGRPYNVAACKDKSCGRGSYSRSDAFIRRDRELHNVYPHATGGEQYDIFRCKYYDVFCVILQGVNAWERYHSGIHIVHETLQNTAVESSWSVLYWLCDTQDDHMCYGGGIVSCEQRIYAWSIWQIQFICCPRRYSDHTHNDGDSALCVLAAVSQIPQMASWKSWCFV